MFRRHAAMMVLAVLTASGCSSNTTASGDRDGTEKSPGSAEAVADTSTADSNSSTGDKSPKIAASRKFRFTYGVTINGLEPGKTARIWLPRAVSSDEQEISDVTVDVPGDVKETKDRAHGNSLIYFEGCADDAGNIPAKVQYTVLRREVRKDSGERATPEEAKTFLAASAFVPVDGSMLAAVFERNAPDASDQMSAGEALYNAVDARMKYDKPKDKPWGRGDAKWACDSRFGNCTDFHSLFISVARDMKIPAKFEIGFPIPTERGEGEVGGYHCWAKFLAGKRWVAVDISEADKQPAMKSYYFGNLTPDRVTFTTGRDLLLDPPQKAGPVNFLVYPYVEVDGRPHTKFTKQFRYEDVK
jgi:transglutaminase-like putative cysteine protease